MLLTLDSPTCNSGRLTQSLDTQGIAQDQMALVNLTLRSKYVGEAGPRFGTIMAVVWQSIEVIKRGKAPQNPQKIPKETKICVDDFIANIFKRGNFIDGESRRRLENVWIYFNSSQEKVEMLSHERPVVR